ncbi:MAG: hypothetical protein ACI9DH_000156 [Halioglobus sp.]
MQDSLLKAEIVEYSELFPAFQYHASAAGTVLKQALSKLEPPREVVAMQTNEVDSQSRVSRAVSDIVVAEMFLVQATIESANVIGDSISELGKQFYWSDEDTPPKEPIKNVLLRTRDEIVESYSSRFNYLRKLNNSDS